MLIAAKNTGVLTTTVMVLIVQKRSFLANYVQGCISKRPFTAWAATGAGVTSLEAERLQQLSPCVQSGTGNTDPTQKITLHSF